MNSETIKETALEEHKIVVIGDGRAGLAAAMIIAEKGRNFFVIEKRKVFGGNTTMASVLFGAETHVQKCMQIEVT